MKVREAIRLIERHGWYLIRAKGSHRQYRHFSRPGTVTIAGKPRVDIPIGTLESILNQAGIEKV